MPFEITIDERLNVRITRLCGVVTEATVLGAFTAATPRLDPSLTREVRVFRDYEQALRWPFLPPERDDLER
jgi:hypothetical protein